MKGGQRLWSRTEGFLTFACLATAASFSRCPALTQCALHSSKLCSLLLQASDKPVMQYTIELWGAQILAFMAEFTGGTGAVLVSSFIHVCL